LPRRREEDVVLSWNGAIAGLVPAGRVLDEQELVAFVEAIPRALDVGAALGEQAAARSFVPLLSTEHVEVWAISWRDEADTGYHDHDLSAGAVHVVSGTLVEDRLVLGRPLSEPLSRSCAAGQTFSFDASHVHRVRPADGVTALSVHAYSPPLRRLGSYEVGPSGELRRVSIPADEELRSAPALTALAAAE
jgi:hypothetical protein